MSIVPLRRVTLCGLLREKREILEGLQAIGVLHLVPLREPPPLAVKDPTQIRRAEAALRHIEEAPNRALPYRADAPCEVEDVIGRLLDNRARLRTLRDRRDDLQARVEALAPWGDLVFPPAEALSGQRLWFYELPVRHRAYLAKLSLPWQIVHQSDNTLYLVVILPEEPPTDCLPVPRVHTGSVPRSVLKREFEDTRIAIEQTEMERVELTRWRSVLSGRLAAAADSEDLVLADAQTLDAEQVFAVQGWAPEEALPAFEAFAAQRKLALETLAPRPEDQPPTLLRQPESFASGSDLTRFYTSPNYHAWDPSLLVFGSFSVFFAMIIADAGYAVLIGLAALLLWRRMGRTPGGRRGRALLASIAGTAFVYGVLCGSYFGLRPPQGGLLAAIAVVDVTKFGQMMALSVVVGAIHISIALAAVAWINRRSGRMVTALGWIAVLWSGIVMLVGGSGDHSFGAGGLVVGLAAVAGGAMMESGGVAHRVSAGLLALTGITKLFGDVLSYLRLFALGLASGSLATTFNSLAVEVKAIHPGVGFALALLILAFGHGVNFLLGLMSGAVHGLRLNFIEFFSWGLPEEGYPFRAFAKRDASVGETQS